MAWEETRSPSFVARHEHRDGEDVVALLELLEGTRAQLADAFGSERLPHEVTVVVHGNDAALGLAHPAFLAARALTAPAARRYTAGWAAERSVHVLAPRVLRARASSVEGSLELALLAPAALYAQTVVGAINPLLAPPHTPRTLARYPRWSWLSHGAAQWLTGQTQYTRPAIARRLREGGRPAFPPGARDALLLGGSVLELLSRRRGEEATLALIAGAGEGLPRAALAAAFAADGANHVESAWREHLVNAATLR